MVAVTKEEKRKLMRMLVDAYGRRDRGETIPVEPDDPNLHVVTYREALDLQALFPPQRGLKQAKRFKQAERAWLEGVMKNASEWHDAVGLPPITGYDTEYRIGIFNPSGFRMNLDKARKLGMPRIDAVAYHANGETTLLEAKVDTGGIDILQGIAQLLYYKTLMEVCQCKKVDNLVMVAPEFPPFIVQTINEHKLPIRLLRITDTQIAGAIPIHIAKQSDLRAVEEAIAKRKGATKH